MKLKVSCPLQKQVKLYYTIFCHFNIKYLFGMIVDLLLLYDHCNRYFLNYYNYVYLEKYMVIFVQGVS